MECENCSSENVVDVIGMVYVCQDCLDYHNKTMKAFEDNLISEGDYLPQPPKDK
jgi:hypothetical protein